MATLVIGDIHGNASALGSLLSEMTGSLRDDDAVVFLGDYIDRGPDSRDCVDLILRFRERTGVEVVTLLGNHEQWMMRTMRDFSRHSWLLGMESLPTVSSYSEEAAARLKEAVDAAGVRIVTEKMELPYEDFFESMPPSHVGFFKDLRTWHRTSDALCVHGGVSLDGTPVEDQDEDSIVWGPDEFPEGYQGEELVVYGHRRDTPVDEKGRPIPRVRRNTIGLDSSRYGVVTAVRLPDRRVFQGGI